MATMAKLRIDWQALLKGERGPGKPKGPEISIYQLAEMTPYSYRQLYTMITDDRPMLNLSVAAAILQALDIDVEWPFTIARLEHPGTAAGPQEDAANT